MANAANTIHLSGGFEREEGIANAAFSPGHLVERMSTDKWRKHATEGGGSERAVAVEDPLQGQTADSPYARTLETAYAADERAQINIMAPGARALVFLEAGVSYAKGDKLISSGAGLLQKLSSAASGVTVRQILAVCEETLDLSATAAVATKAVVRFI